MLNHASQQLNEFLYSAVFGIFCGMLYDMFSLARLHMHGKRFVQALVDLAFCLTCIMALFAFLLLVTDGRLRWYIIFANFFGFFIYKNTISGLFFSGVCSIIKLAVRFLNFSVSPIYKLKARFNAKGSEAEDGKKEEKKA